MYSASPGTSKIITGTKTKLPLESGLLFIFSIELSDVPIISLPS